VGSACNNLLPQDLCCIQRSTLVVVVDRDQQLTQLVGKRPPVEEGWLILQPEVVEVLLGAGNCLPSLLTYRSPPSVDSADSGRNSDLRWTQGLSRDLKCNTDGVAECNACGSLMGVVSSRICGGNTRPGGSSQ
jgi:hypothetical protein